MDIDFEEFLKNCPAHRTNTGYGACYYHGCNLYGDRYSVLGPCSKEKCPLLYLTKFIKGGDE